MSDHPDAVTVSMRASDFPIEQDGSERTPCEGCGEAVVLSPATVIEMERGVYPEYVLCVQCAADDVDEADTDEGGDGR